MYLEAGRALLVLPPWKSLVSASMNEGWCNSACWSRWQNAKKTRHSAAVSGNGCVRCWVKNMHLQPRSPSVVYSDSLYRFSDCWCLTSTTRSVKTYGLWEFCRSGAKVDGFFLLHDANKVFLSSKHGYFLCLTKQCALKLVWIVTFLLHTAQLMLITQLWKVAFTCASDILKL